MALAADEFAARARGIRLAAFDVDGVLTDGRLVLGPAGEEYKVFHVRDGHGLKELQGAGIVLAIITGRSSPVVAARMHELGILHVHQGVADKGTCLAQLLTATAIPARAALYMGDDLPDLPAFDLAGLAVAVADAVPAVRARAHWVTRAAGGRGAVREVADALLAARAGPA